MTIKDLLGCYVETLGKDIVRIHIKKSTGNNELVFRDYVENLDEAFEDLEVIRWFAVPVRDVHTDTEIDIFVRDKDYKALDIKEDELEVGDITLHDSDLHKPVDIEFISPYQGFARGLTDFDGSISFDVKPRNSKELLKALGIKEDPTPLTKSINLVDSLKEVPLDVLSKYGAIARYISIINYLKDRGTL